MEDDAVQFLLKRHSFRLGIFLNPVHANIDFGGTFQVKGDDIGIVIVLEISAIDVKQVGVRAKDDIEGIKGNLVLFKSGNDKTPQPGALQ